MAKGGRWMRHFGSRGKVVRCANPCRYGCQRTQKLESRMLRKRARPVRRGEVRKGLSEIPPERSGGSEAQTVPRWPPTLPQRDVLPHELARDLPLTILHPSVPESRPRSCKQADNNDEVACGGSLRNSACLLQARCAT